MKGNPMLVHESIEEPFICKMTMNAEEACKFSRKNVGRVCFVQGIDWEKATDYDDTVRCSVTFAPYKFTRNENAKETK